MYNISTLFSHYKSTNAIIKEPVSKNFKDKKRMKKNKKIYEKNVKILSSFWH